MKTITREKPVKKPLRKLKFNHLEKDDIVLNLRQLSIKYKVHYNKLRSYHWKVEDSDFYELKKEFDNRYLIIQNKIDMIATRIYDFNQPSKVTIEEGLKNASSKEQLSIIGLLTIINDIIKDFGDLHEAMLKVQNPTLHISDTATKHVKTEFINCLVGSN